MSAAQYASRESFHEKCSQGRSSVSHEEFDLILCFRPDCIVAMDACFTHKHNKQIWDPEHPHPYNVFIPEPHVKAMEDYIQSIWGPTRASRRAKQKRKEPDESQDDGFDRPELKVPCSVLDSCQESFTAADNDTLVMRLDLQSSKRA